MTANMREGGETSTGGHAPDSGGWYTVISTPRATKIASVASQGTPNFPELNWLRHSVSTRRSESALED